jgi:hypothetical protein
MADTVGPQFNGVESDMRADPRERIADSIIALPGPAT